MEMASADNVGPLAAVRARSSGKDGEEIPSNHPPHRSPQPIVPRRIEEPETGGGALYRGNHQSEEHARFVAALERHGSSARAWRAMARELDWSVDDAKVYAYSYFISLIRDTPTERSMNVGKDDEGAQPAKKKARFFAATETKEMAQMETIPSMNKSATEEASATNAIAAKATPAKATATEAKKAEATAAESPTAKTTATKVPLEKLVAAEVAAVKAAAAKATSAMASVAKARAAANVANATKGADATKGEATKRTPTTKCSANTLSSWSFDELVLLDSLMLKYCNDLSCLDANPSAETEQPTRFVRQRTAWEKIAAQMPGRRSRECRREGMSRLLCMRKDLQPSILKTSEDDE